jgi:CDP-diacylglycerol---glycerol-3-phosphate 3-phosphatidyltransferase
LFEYEVSTLNIPNRFTVFRIALIPVFVVLFYLPFAWSHVAAASVFAVCALTDWIDGFLARRLNQSSAFGAFLDPVADKLIVVVALVLLVGNPGLPYIAIPAAIIVAREVAVSALREWMAEIGKRASVAVSFVAKCKTAMQMSAIIFLLDYHPNSPIFVPILGYAFLYFSAGLTLWTMTAYLRTAWPDLELNAQ